MPNWCDNVERIAGPKEQVKALCDNLNKWIHTNIDPERPSDKWLGNIVYHSGLATDKNPGNWGYPCRGELVDGFALGHDVLVEDALAPVQVPADLPQLVRRPPEIVLRGGLFDLGLPASALLRAPVPLPAFLCSCACIIYGKSLLVNVFFRQSYRKRALLSLSASSRLPMYS